MEKVFELPVQVTPFVNFGVTVIFATIGALVVLMAFDKIMAPVPLAAKPIAVLSFVQEKTVPPTEPEKLFPEMADPLQTTVSAL